MLKELKAPQNDSNAWCSQSDRLQMAEDTLSAVRRVRREVVESMRMLMKAAKDKRSEGMFAIIEEMLRKTKCLCNLLDSNLVEETLTFLEDNRYIMQCLICIFRCMYLFWIMHPIPSCVRYPKEILNKAAKNMQKHFIIPNTGWFF